MIDKTEIEIISFDLDDTFWDNKPVLSRANQAMLQWLHQHCPKTRAHLNQDNYTDWLKKTFAADQPQSYDLSLLRLRALEALLTPLGYDKQAAQQAFACFMQARQAVTFYDDVLPALQQLSNQYRLVTLTNGNICVDDLAIAGFFECTFSAASLQAAKPSLQIYQAMLKAMKAKPQQVLHVGDSLQHDIHPALEVGMQAAWINRPSHHNADPRLELAQQQRDCFEQFSTLAVLQQRLSNNPVD